MNHVRLDARPVPARTELLLAAELGEDAPGRPIYARPEPYGGGGGEPAARIKVGAVLTRRLSAAEVTETPARAAYGNPLRGRPKQPPRVPIGSALFVRTDAADARGRESSPGKAVAHDAAHRHAADQPAVATVLTTTHGIHPDHRRLRRRPHLHSPRRRALEPRRFLRQSALMTAAHADPSRHVSIRCAPGH